MEIARDVIDKFPDLALIETTMPVIALQSSPALEEFKAQLCAEIRNSYSIETVKDAPVFRAYRDFFWSIGIDPTKTRPAAEALIRRILQGKELPRINTVVDAYNLASAKSHISVAAFDTLKLKGTLRLRFAKPGEKFIGIGMQTPILLDGNEPVIEDSGAPEPIAVYPYRDSDSTKITESTREAVFIMCGAPGIALKSLEKAKAFVSEYVGEFCKK
ncbi:MAG: phenylalanine--tRNA ligase beta subunit-related protein [Candidatus Thermoplasmatota archaeon]|nr:phenylalanine--tRNA ligase beta subunit-related protein [Candidatus Thermoplasmatota archaeon]